MKQEIREKQKQRKLEKQKFLQQLDISLNAANQEIFQNWTKKLNSFKTKARRIDVKFVNLDQRLSSIHQRLETQLNIVKEQNQALAIQIEEEKTYNIKLQKESEQFKSEINAENDRECRLQAQSVDLDRQLHERIQIKQHLLDEKIKLKKNIIRSREKYKKLRSIQEKIENLLIQVQKEDQLKEKKRFIEEEEKKKKEYENSPEALYAKFFPEKYQTIPQNPSSFTEYNQDVGPIQFPKNKTTKPMIINAPAPIDTYNSQIDQNIRSLLSTGIYTEDDPIIRTLKEAKKKL